MHKKRTFINAAEQIRDAQYERYTQFVATLPMRTRADVAKFRATLDLLTAPNNADAVARMQSDFPEIFYMVQNYGVDDTINRMKSVIAMGDKVPANAHLADIAAMPDVEYIAGRFSTFNAVLNADAKSDTVSPHALRTKIVANMPNLGGVSHDMTAKWMDVISRNRDIVDTLLDAGMHATTGTWSRGLYVLAANMMRQMGMDPVTLRLHVIDDWRDTEPAARPPVKQRKYASGQCIVFGNKNEIAQMGTIYINRRNIFNGIEFDWMRDNTTLFIGVMDALAHEFSHLVDGIAPNRGALGAQNAILAKRVYKKFTAQEHQEYLDNPAEVAAYNIGDQIARELGKKMY